MVRPLLYIMGELLLTAECYINIKPQLNISLSLVKDVKMGSNTSFLPFRHRQESVHIPS